MDMQHNVPLNKYSTMRLGGSAAHMCEVLNKDQLAEAVEWAQAKDLPVIVIGEGSNIVWKDEGFNGLVIVNKISGFTKLSEDDTSATYELGAGEDWDACVGKLTAESLSGVECLSLIPGKVGATPVQNVGAYGQEISQTLVNVWAYDTKQKTFVRIENKDCAFGYRTSRFKTIDKGRFFIVSIILKLSKTPLQAPFYASLQAYLDQHNINDFTPQIIRDAVVTIRRDKMPDWHVVANNGSFFANPIVDSITYQKIKAQFPKIVAWQYQDGYKLSAGWLLEQAGFKGYHDAETGMATSDKTALVLINEHATSTADLLQFKQKIVDKVQDMFGITLEQEPELIP